MDLIRPTTIRRLRRAVGREPTTAFLVVLLAGAGVGHFVRPSPFVSIVPRRLPEPELLVALSGAAELGSAALLAVPSTRRVGGVCAAALFVAVFPANVSMALRSGRPSEGRGRSGRDQGRSGRPSEGRGRSGRDQGSRRRGSPVPRLLTWLRLPLQVPLVLWALRAGRHPTGPGPGPVALH